ncbi:MAG TPA: RHS repeat-associated core domain-containing protein, partial [Ferruginibacter sp.]|nr:RHS repeat-associated core domain-containing protein [Ferruginibacter sp.]
NLTTSGYFKEFRSYPFGLTTAGISSKANQFGNPENRMKFNGYEQQNKEFSDGTGLEWHDYKHRFYDNQIGRFFAQDGLAHEYVYYSPYQFAGNEVPNAIDLDGLEPHYMIDSKNPPNYAKKETQDATMKALGKWGTVVKVFVIGAISVVQPEIGIPLMVADITGVPVTPSPQAMASAAAASAGDDLAAASNIKRNAAQGAAFEQKVGTDLAKAGDTKIAPQITIKADNGVKTRVDFVSTNQSGKIVLTEAKSSSTAPLTGNQKVAHPSIAQSGGFVVGKGKPGYPGGTVIPPTNVNIVRPIAKDATNLRVNIPIYLIPSFPQRNN